MRIKVGDVVELLFGCIIVGMVAAPAFSSREPGYGSSSGRIVTEMVETNKTYELSRFFPDVKHPDPARRPTLTSTTIEAFKIDVERNEISFLVSGAPPALCDLEREYCKVFLVSDSPQ